MSGGAAAGGSAGGQVSGELPGVTCSADRFCWEGQPYAGSFNAVHGTSASFVVAVGEGGVIGTWNGTALTFSASPTRATLRGVWFASPTLGWAVGDGGVILEWNGGTWRSVASGTTAPLTAIHGAGTSIYIGGKDVLLTRRNGAWEPLAGVLPVTDSPAIVSTIAVESASSVWVAGSSGGFFFLHWDGQQWATATSTGGQGPSTSDQLFSVSVCGGAVFASGGYSGEFHASWSFVNGAWATHFATGARSVCLSDGEFLSFGSSFTTNEAVQLVALDQRTPQTVGSGLSPNAGYAAGPRDVFLVGNRALFTHWVGATLAPPAPKVTKVVASSATNVLRVLGTDLVERRDGSGQWQPLSVPGTGSIVDVFSAVEGDVWVLRQGSVAHHLVNGTWSSELELPAGTSFIRGAGPADVWFSGGAGVVSRWNGSALMSSFLPTQNTTGPVHLAGADVWVPTMSSNGVGFTYRRSGASSWQSVSGLLAWRVSGSGSDVVFSTVQGLHRWTAGAIVDVPNTQGTSLLAASSSDVFAAWERYEVGGRVRGLGRLPLAGGAVTALELGTSEALTSLSATPDGHVWATVVGGGLLHFSPEP